MRKFLLFFCIIFGIQFLLQNEIYSQWLHTGPEGGEIRAFCVSDTYIFAAPWSGGIYRSTNNGTSWTEVNTGLTDINIAVAALVADGNNIFAGTWGNGVFRSTNFGENWDEVNSSSTANTNVHAFVKSGTNLFMGSQGGGVHRTTDNGETWVQVNNGLLSVDIRDLTAMDTVIFAATWGQNKVFKSTDSGENWIQCNTAIIPNLDDPCIIASGNNVFLGTFNHGVFLSTDSGDNWLEVNNGIPANATIREFAVSGSNIFAATRGDGVFLTTDNGTSWSAVNNGLTTDLIESIIVHTNQEIFAGTFRKGVFRSTDNGANWFEANTNLNANTIHAYTKISDGVGGYNLLAGTTDGVYQSTNNGIDWTFLGLDDAWVTGIAVIDSDIFVSTMGTGIFRSTDQGASWMQSGLSTAMLHTLYTDGNDLFAGIAFFGGAQRSTDRGTTWAPIAGLEFKWVMSFTENEDYMFAGAVFGGAFRSSDGGNSFSPINNGLSNNNVSTLAVMDSSTIFAGTGDPNGVSAAGVFRSDDNGDNWTQINNGLPPNLIVWSLAVTDSNIFASSSSSGQNKVAEVYLSTDRGENWSTVSTGLVSNYIQALIIHNTNIFAGTLGSSTWWRPLAEMIPELLPLNPSNLVAVADTFSVTLNWQDNSDNENGFVIERKDGDSLSAAPFEALDTVNTNINEYVDTGLEADYTYTYRVYAYNEFGTSAYSNLAQVTTLVPVELTSFTAIIGENDVTLNWTTATELNNQGFEIERKPSGYEFEKIGYVPGYGTTTEPKTYSFIDENVTAGLYKYRLKQIDFGGTLAYSEEVAVEIDFTPNEFALFQNYPNPFNPTTKIEYSIAASGLVTIEVYNSIGEKVSELVNRELDAGNYEVDFDGRGLSSGIYYYKISSGSFTDIKKMVLLK